MKRSEVTLSVLIDYSKSFDTIDHRILLEKLQDMNSPKNTIKIICSYPIELYQYVQRTRDQPYYLFFGVPQGSILDTVTI